MTTITEEKKAEEYRKRSKEARWEIFKRLKYEPSPEQELVHFADLEHLWLRIKLITGGERAGKSLLADKEVMSRFWEGKLYWLGGQDYEEARPEFGYCLQDAQTLGLLETYSFPKEGPCSLTLTGGVVIKTRSFKDIQKIGMEAPDGIVICEAAQVTWDVVERCRTRVSASKGWLLLEGTMEGSIGYYAELSREWAGPNNYRAKSFTLPSWSNHVHYPGGRDDPQIKFMENTLPEDVFLERYAGVPCPISQMVIKDFRNDIHLGDFPFDPNLPVEITIDPGWAGAYTVLACQWRGETLYIIDEVYLQGYTTEEIISMCQVKPWFRNIRGGTIDIAAPDEHKIWQEKTELILSKKLLIRKNKVEIEAGINRLRTYLKPHPVTGKPLLFVDKKCRGIISEWGGGRSPVHGGGAWLRDKNTNRPLKKNDHASKAVYYMLVDKMGYVTVEHPVEGIPVWVY